MSDERRNNGLSTGSAATRFKPGNPGRPKGARHKTTLMAEKLMAQDTQEIVNAVLTAAKAGDMTAARIVLDRICPIRKGRPVPLSLPDVTTADGVHAAMVGVVSEMSAGNVTPEEAATVATVLGEHRKAIETKELEERLRLIEGLVNPGKGNRA